MLSSDTKSNDFRFWLLATTLTSPDRLGFGDTLIRNADLLETVVRSAHSAKVRAMHDPTSSAAPIPVALGLPIRNDE